MDSDSSNDDHRLGEPGPEDRDDGLQALGQLRNNDSLGWQAALVERDALERFDLPTLAPAAEQLEELRGGAFAQFLPSTRVRPTELSRVDDPVEANTFGLVGSSVRLDGDQIMPGVLAIRFDPKNLGTVAPDTLKIFQLTKSSQLVPLSLSDVDIEGGFVWGFVNAPGQYTVVGLNTDPGVLATIMTLQANDAWLKQLPEDLQRGFLDSVCGLILCAPDAKLGGGAGNVCERCLGSRVPWQSMPEWNLFDRPVAGGGGFFELPEDLCRHRWECMGPTNIAGCMLDVAVDPVNPRVVYAASANGGLWRLDANTSFTAMAWTPLFDDLDNMSIVAVAISPVAHNVVFTADTTNRVLRSTNGGSAWTPMAAGATMGHVYRLVGHPSNADEVYAATTTGLWLVDRTVAPVLLQPGDVTDVARDPLDGTVLYAAVRNIGLRRRDTTGTWATVLTLQAAAQLSVGTYIGLMIKVAVGGQGTTATRRIAVKFGPRNIDAAGNATTGPALSEVFVNPASGLGTWRRCMTPPALGNWSQGDWVNVVAIDPAHDDTMLVGGERLARTQDGGQSWTTVMRYLYEIGGSNDHEDQHGVTFVESAPGVCYVANDGGIYRSTDSGATWAGINAGLVTTQPFNFGLAGDKVLVDVYHWGVLGSISLATKQFTVEEGGSWEFVPVRGNPNQRDVFYYLRGAVTRRKFPRTGVDDYTVYTPFPISWGLAFHPRATSKLAFAGRWTTATSSSDIWRTTASDQLTPAWTQDMITGANLSSPIVAIHFAESDPEYAYAITSAGDVVRTIGASNAATAWSFRGQWQSGVRSMAVNQFDPNRLYAVDTWNVGRSIDGGATWTHANGVSSNALPSSELTTILTSPRSAGDLFAATAVGVMYSPDEGYHWYPIHDGLPNARVTEIAWSDGYLYVALHGRGFWRAKPYG